MSKIGDRVKELVTLLREDSGAGDREAARSYAARVPEDVARYMAGEYLADQVCHAIRQETLAAERTAIRARVLQEFSAGQAPESRSFGRPKRGTARYQEWVATTDEGKRYEERMVEYDEQESEARRRFFEKQNQIVQEYAAEIRLELTNELLSSAFALGDGTWVTWGEATAEQHRERRDMFLSNAVANTQGAARHEKALAALEAAHVDTLREIPARAA